MRNCPYTCTCTRASCDRACSDFSEFEHWRNRCKLNYDNPVFQASDDDLAVADYVIRKAEQDVEVIPDSSYMHLSTYLGNKSVYFADLISYVAITKSCYGQGFYGGVYKLSFSDYIQKIKDSWSSRYQSTELENMKIWIQSSQYLVIYNLSLVRFGDFEAQTLMSIFNDRYIGRKYTILCVDSMSGISGKFDSPFYTRIKREIMDRGVAV